MANLCHVYVRRSFKTVCSLIVGVAGSILQGHIGISSVLCNRQPLRCSRPRCTLQRWERQFSGGISHRSEIPPENCRSHRCKVHRGLEQRDRKSTRLNSSHVAISYAVIFLKKK